MKSCIIFIALLLIAIFGVGQSKCRINIQELMLSDSVLIDVIHQVIQGEEQSSDSANIFRKKLGYINVFITEPYSGDTLFKYYIQPAMHAIKETADDNLYPLFYSYVDEKLVLIHIDALKNISSCPFNSKSKRKIRKKVNDYLEPTKKVTFYDMNHKPVFTDKNFRIDYFIFHGGKTVFIMRNSAPIIIDNKDL